MSAARPGGSGVLGLVCGSGVLPRLVAEEARAAGRRVVAVAHVGETDPGIEGLVDALTWVRLGQLGRIREALVKEGAEAVCLAGGVTKVRFFRDARPDGLGLKVLAKVAAGRGDDRLLRAIVSVFEDAGMEVVAATEVAPGLLADEGALGRRKPTKAQVEDARTGLAVLAALGPLDVGQAVVVKDGIVLAVEAAEGTDACLQRGCELGRGDVVLVKAAKPGQDLRFDLPAVGPRTVDLLREGGGGALALQAGRTVVLDRAALVERADAAGIPVFGL